MFPEITILNVDNDVGSREARSRMLRDAGFRVVETIEAGVFEAATRNSPDLILLAHQEEACIGICKYLTGRPETASVPVLRVESGSVSAERLAGQIAWLARGGGSADYQQPYGNLARLNRLRVVAGSVGEDVLPDMVSDYLELLDTASAVYEKNGDYALGAFASAWCRFLDARSRELCGTPDNREALASGKWICHEECWRASRASMQIGAPVDVECPGGLRLYALPIRAGEEIVGSVNFGYGDPPRDPEKLAAIAARYQVSTGDLRAQAAAYQSRPPQVIQAAKRRLRTSARVIGTIVGHKRAEDRLRRLQTVTALLAQAVTTEHVLDTIIDEVMRVTGAEAGLLLLFTPDGKEVVAPRIAGYPAEVARQLARMPLDTPLPSVEAARTGRPVLLEKDCSLHYPALPPGPDGAIAALPLTVRDQVIGALGLRFPDERQFGPEDRDFLVTVGRECAQALERARAYDAERRLLAEVSRENQRLEEIFSALPGFFAIFNGPRHIVEFSNPENVRLWGGRNPIGTPLREAFPELGEDLFTWWDQVYRTGQPLRFHEAAIPVPVPREGRAPVFDLSLLPRWDAGGKVCGVLAFANEVSAQVHARHEVERQRAFMEAVLDQMPMGVALADSGSVVFLNEEARRLMGGADPAAAAQKLFAETGTPKEIVHKRAGGAALHLAVRGASVRGAEGRTVAEVRAFTDISERLRAQRMLNQQAQSINLSHDAIITADSRRVITGWNAGAEEMYGYNTSEAIGHVVEELLHTRGQISTGELVAILRRDGRWQGELLHTGRDGREIVADSRHVLIRDEDGNTAGFLEINRDVTERRRAEQALRESEEWLKFTQTAAGVGILDWDVAAGTAKWSDELFRIHGLRPRPGLVSRAEWENLIHPEHREEVRRKIADALAGGGAGDLEYRILWPDGSARWVGFKGTVFFDQAGQPLRMIAATLDVTERKRAEEAQRNAQKLETLGVLAGGVAHDFNNLLTSILGNASLALDDVSEESRERLRNVIAGAERAADLTRQLLAYAGKGRFLITDLNLDALVREMSELMRLTIPKSIDLQLDLVAGLPLIRADAGQMQQVVMNLLMNAAEAIGEGQPGTVSVRTGCQDIALPFDDGLLGRAAAGRYVYVEVTDTGCGMEEATRSRIFDPFFTTKFIGRGLGLAAVSGILRSHRGAIFIDTAPGAGSRFRVLFPAVQEVRTAIAPADVKADVDGTGTVLVVDDEHYVRAFLEGSLKRGGYEVLLAANGRDAITALEQHSDIRLVVLDLIMPGLGGGDALGVIRRRWPGLRVLVTSGYDQAEAERLCASVQMDGFIQKPYTAKDFMAKVKTVLESA